ncbi:MAG: diguanylate cyclase [Desulfoarculaceae bacterium]|nr:diguanylate cyclase [Desulfoarculaceae bacterium]
MTLQRPEFCHSIRFKIPFLLFLILILSIGFAMFGLWHYQRNQFIDIANHEAMRGGQIIEKTLQHSMLINDRAAIQATVNEIGAIFLPPSRISIIDNNGTVRVSNDPAMVGQGFADWAKASHMDSVNLEDSATSSKAVLLQTERGPLLRNTVMIKNAPECYQCHSAKETHLGMVIYDANFSRTYAILKTVALRMLLTGLVTLLVMSFVLSWAINKYIHQPIENLSNGFMHVGEGDFDFWVDEESSTEFGYMADAFNVMSKAMGRYINEVKSKTMETSILYSIVQELSKTIEWERLQRIIINLLNQIFEGKVNGLIVPLPKKENCLDIIWQRHTDSRISRETYCLDQENLRFSGISREELLDWYRGNQQSSRFSDDLSTVLIPLEHNQASMGLLCVQREAGQEFTRHERAIIPALASHIAISLANSRLYHMANTDGLTDLYAKRYFLNKLEALEIQHQNNPDSHSAWFAIMLDIDHFKAVNDTHGHQVGDDVLVQLAEIMRQNIRFEDIAFRYGGEEFIILVPVTGDDHQLGPEIAERLRTKVADHSFACQDGTILAVTISLGVSHFPGNGTTAAEFVKAADVALYKAKDKGRNQVQIAPVSAV